MSGYAAAPARRHDTRVFSNPGNTTVTFGENTENEMCFNFAVYYPMGALGGGFPGLCAEPSPRKIGTRSLGTGCRLTLRSSLTAMQAVVYSAYGPPSVLSLQDIPLPELGDHDVLVRVYAASVNSWDTGNLLGKFANRGMLGWRKPGVRVLGGDIAGCVERVGRAVTRWKAGDAVLGDLSGSGWGAFAEYARAPEQVLCAKPAGLGFAQAAALPQAAVIALQGIRDHGQVRAGQRVLVSGAGGGVGSFAVQLARMYGAEVTGVDGEPKLALVRSLGAAHVLDYRRQDYAQGRERYDFILDCELHRSPRESLRALTPQGRLTVLGGANVRILQTFLLGRWRARRPGPQLDVLMHRANHNLDELARLAAEGRIQPAIEREYALAEVPEALARMCQGAVLGKAVIAIRPA